MPRCPGASGSPSRCRPGRGLGSCTSSRRSALGGWLAGRGIEVVFTWKAVVLATGVMSFPLLVRSARTAFEEVDPRLVGLARTLGCPPAEAFFRVTLPLAWRGVLAGV